MSPTKRQSPLAALVGSFSEAWAEVRIHRTRVLLSLIGVAVAVAAITSVVGLGAIVEQSVQESNERNGGRPATIGVSAYTQNGASFDAASLRTTLNSAIDRYKIRYHTSILSGQLSVQFVAGAALVNTTAIDVDYGVMHRVKIKEGSWFTEKDINRLAPALVVNRPFWALMGSPDLRTHPTVRILGAHPITAVIVGVRAVRDGDMPDMMMLTDAFRVAAEPTTYAGQSQFEAWVPPPLAKRVTARLTAELAASVPSGVDVQVNRQDYAAFGADPIGPVRIAVGAVAALVLFLGALGLVNISLVTVRQRIREIGIRRSFGATAGRVFFAVMMESVVATAAAGVVGVGVAVAVVENPWVQEKLSHGITDLPSFPIGAALFGLAAATLVGALAGLLPAIAAVRFKVIDAIRY
ncbi:ABC transporter permease [Glaciihabitans sp. GrIS 2.15]|uniref:ABC transporter permease n=1 Tax=Glaciihabitans sp. GrIS 2.15 TaxID=3071710 RepID=UPI0019B860C5|nr:ABC transporter permease [Microbacteriaceae bacterium]MEC5168356.1 putative ABC transport system permease protein [Glaciihabitans sp. GrIS 2.15]